MMYVYLFEILILALKIKSYASIEADKGYPELLNTTELISSSTRIELLAKWLDEQILKT